MKNINELEIPKDAFYTMNHEWAKPNGNTVKVGITDYAQDQLGEIIYVELPLAGIAIDQGEEFGTVESTKAVSELLMPVSGEIIAVNTALDDSPELVNSDPHQDGWMIEVATDRMGALEKLMEKDAYLEMLKRME